MTDKEKLVKETENAREITLLIEKGFLQWAGDIHKTQWEFYEDTAYEILDNGYRKVSEGAVILTKEEYDRFEETKNDTIQKKEEYIKGLMELKKEKENIRKDTAREIIKDIDEIVKFLKEKYKVEVSNE